MQTVTIRPLILNDIPVIAGWMVTVPLWQRYRLTEEKARLQFEQALQRAEALTVADFGPEDHACGFAWCIHKGAFGRSTYLRLIGVREDRAGYGIGAALLSHAEQAAQAVCDDLFLLVSDFNVEAQRFYVRQGYQQIGAIPGYVLPDVTELIFRKRLR